MKALIIHPFLGSHYKAIIFSELEKIASGSENLDVHVIQLFANEATRAGMEQSDNNIHNYSYECLFDSDSKPPSLIQKYIAIQRVLKEYEPDIINVTGYYDWAVNLIMIVYKLLGKRMIMSIDSTLMDQKGSVLKRVIKSFLLFWPDGFFCYGSKSTELIEHYGRNGNDVLVQKNAVPNKTLQNIQTDFISANGYKHWRSQFPKYNFIFVGRLITEKNVELLIKAFKDINLKDWGLIIVGNGELRHDLEKRANNPSIYFEGGKSWTEIPHYFSASDVFVLPSKSEPWGLVVNEAMACSLPVVSSDACGATFDLVLNKNTGIAFSNNNLSDLKEAMSKLATNEKLRLEMGLNAKELIKSYDPQLLAREMWDGFIKFA